MQTPFVVFSTQGFTLTLLIIYSLRLFSNYCFPDLFFQYWVLSPRSYSDQASDLYLNYIPCPLFVAFFQKQGLRKLAGCTSTCNLPSLFLEQLGLRLCTTILSSSKTNRDNMCDPQKLVWHLTSYHLMYSLCTHIRPSKACQELLCK